MMRPEGRVMEQIGAEKRKEKLKKNRSNGEGVCRRGRGFMVPEMAKF